jgi:hypothetical protein
MEPVTHGTSWKVTLKVSTWHLDAAELHRSHPTSPKRPTAFWTLEQFPCATFFLLMVQTVQYRYLDHAHEHRVQLVTVVSLWGTKG